MSKYVRPKLKSWCVNPPKMEVGRQAPAKSVAYRVQDGDSWQSLATQWGLDVWSLINFNFRTYEPTEVNWYLQEYVGCVQPTLDRKNWCFSSAATPGIIYRPLEKTGQPVPGRVPVPMPTPGPGPIDQPWKPGTGAWLGVGVKGGGHVVLGGADSAVMIVFSMDDPRDFVLMNITMGRLGPGLGASGGMVVCGIANCYDPRALRGYPVSGADFTLAVGAKLSSLLKVARIANVVAEAVDAGRDAAKLIRAGAVNLAVREKMINGLKAFNGASTLFPQKSTSELTINVVDLPIGGGAEASVYYGWGHVEVLKIHEVA
jgi:hypothetical protein